MNSFTSKQVQGLKRGVRGALAFGVLTSIAANVINSLTHHHVQVWQIYTSAGLAALAPLVLFISTEMVTRIPIHSRVLGWIRLGITLALAGFAGWISYWHMVDVARMLGEAGGSEYIYPLIIDGMMVVATISLIELGRLGHAVLQIVVADAEEQAQARKCKPDCTCKRHNRKAPARRRRTVKTPASAPTSPGYGPVTATSVEELEEAVR